MYIGRTSWKRIQSEYKLKDDTKCKGRKKTKYCLEKVRKRSFKIENFLLKYFFEKNKKLTSRLTPYTRQCMYVLLLEVEAFVDIEKK